MLATGAAAGTSVLVQVARKPSAVTEPSDVQRMMTAKLAYGLSPATVQRQRATLRAALKHALR